MSIAAGLREIVDRLNAPPLYINLSLVQFDELPASTLLSVVNKVLAVLDPRHNVDIDNERMEDTYKRMVDFITVLGYPDDSAIASKEGFMNGDKRVLHPLLYWLLVNLTALKERAYLARFLTNFEVPQDFLQDYNIADMYSKYKELQSTFKATHSALQHQRETSAMPEELKRDIQQLSVEKDQLIVKIKALKHRTTGDAEFNAIFDVTSRLRHEQEEEAQLADTYRKQRRQLEEVERLHRGAVQRLQEMRQARAEAEEEPGRMLEARIMLAYRRGVGQVIRKDVHNAGVQLERMKAAHDALCEELESAEKQLSVPSIDDATLLDMEEKLESLQEEVESMESSLKSQLQAQASVENKGGGLQVYRQQAQLVAKKHEALSTKVEAMEIERNAAALELEKLESKYEQQMGHRYLRREDFKEYAVTLREKTKKFKSAKSEMQRLRSEGSILKRTEQLLKEKLEDSKRRLRAVEEEYGVVGHDELESRLMEASEAKSAADAKKGSQMEELSEVVTKINLLLREKKNELAPRIKVLRTTRERLAEAEAIYLTKKTKYEAIETDLSREVKERKSVTERLLEETESLRSRAAEIELKIIATESLMERGEREQQCLDGSMQFSKDHPTLSSVYAAKIGEVERTCQALKVQEKDVQDSFDRRVHQKQLFERLNRLLEVKLRSLATADGEVGLGRVEHLAKGVNRLIIEGN
ncbi:Intraflagellar transport, putative [Perkinsus marinus ATCC 50983]|uniref:Intraflagellar transport, putative n=1 Tax=Perkinsus marinus (strain ATCC 50983 / TXsc) TaxID=423536 RepID=C5LY13_PERM5|nr:Intraflagellar transport, putative [Perkinsus marinus ATCC 50983]EEQ98343.1 Intraflagellar transport, putative [Perkinsus marinus ATCC 50983]|eukprot:XP_002765626.1 Intraflagellar transport, putative [Perkinsus marinus ATCC 50983]